MHLNFRSKRNDKYLSQFIWSVCRPRPGSAV